MSLNSKVLSDASRSILFRGACCVSALGLLTALGGCGESKAGESGAGGSLAGAVAAQFDPGAQCLQLASSASSEGGEGDREPAYQACKAAVSRTPNDPDAVYRLGLTATLTERSDEARAAFTKAADLGVCESHFYLGETAWLTDSDAVEAQRQYEAGAECGDEQAAAAIFSPRLSKMSAHPDLLRALYDGDVETLNKTRFLSASYVSGLYELMAEQYVGQPMQTCWREEHYRGGDIQLMLDAAEKGDGANPIEAFVYERTMPLALRIMLPSQGSRALEDYRVAQRKAGQADMQRVVAASRCGALLPSKIIAGIEAFANAKRSFAEVAINAIPSEQMPAELQKLLQFKMGGFAQK